MESTAVSSLSSKTYFESEVTLIGTPFFRDKDSFSLFGLNEGVGCVSFLYKSIRPIAFAFCSRNIDYSRGILEIKVLRVGRSTGS